LKYAHLYSASISENPHCLLIEALDIWPNPARGIVYARVALPQGRTAVKLNMVNLLGRRVLALYPPETVGSGNAMLTLRLPESIATGEYFLRMEHDGGRLVVPLTILK
jgi:hypothetical protein